MYDPEVEIAFWAELFQPRRGGGRQSLLTDELCGGSGSRFTIIRGGPGVGGTSGLLDEDDGRLEKHLLQAMATREEAGERASPPLDAPLTPHQSVVALPQRARTRTT